MIDPPSKEEIPPLPHLIGNKVVTGAKKRANWVSLIVNTIMLLLGTLFLYWILRFIVTTGVRPHEVLQFPRNVLIVFVLLSLSGTYMFVRSLQGFVTWFKQRKENAASRA